ncbi:MAG: Sua5/YciO/YrdC/YwlC family protein, partial [Rikenellaceae bacterium]
MKEEIEKAIEVLKNGGLILYPTDTVWGIGCDATNEEAVQKVYDIKGSVNKKSMLLLVENLDRVLFYLDKVPDVEWDIFEVA